jgi:uncharacterized protein (TIGR03905 family)
MHYQYQTQGTCSRLIDFEVVDEKVTKVSFLGGCNGNLQGISRLVEGMKIDDVIARLKGIDCNGKGTSCPDQFACALSQIK